tara:strand:- start:434 stop:868 length:435 start_codon:yes stop_codon:yes gene_type:complete
MAKKPFINKYGFVEYPFLHDTRKAKNWWFYNLLEDHLKRRAKHKYKLSYTQDHMTEDFKAILGITKIKIYAIVPSGMGMVFPLIGKFETKDIVEIEDPNPWLEEKYGGSKYKVNIYHEGTFAGTENYKTHGDPTWTEIEDDELT